MFQKGKSGNPHGRPPKGTCLSDLLEEQLVAIKVETDDGKLVTAKVAIIHQLIKLAVGGDIAAIKLIYDRIDGLPIQKTELTGAEGGGIEIIYAKEFQGV